MTQIQSDFMLPDTTTGTAANSGVCTLAINLHRKPYLCCFWLRGGREKCVILVLLRREEIAIKQSTVALALGH